MMPRVFNQEKANTSLLIVARRRYWRHLNDPFREVYREHRTLFCDSFPDYQPCNDQVVNMIALIDLLQRTNSSNWVEIAELCRELGDFASANEALKTHKGNITTIIKVIHDLIKLSVSAPARYKP